MTDDNRHVAAPETMRNRLQKVHRSLLRLHKVLLDAERQYFERENGAVSSGQMLHLVINDPFFAWLRGISALIVRIDELLDEKDPLASTQDAEALMEQIKSLLIPTDNGTEFAIKYIAALQRDPDAVLTHREVIDVLSAPETA